MLRTLKSKVHYLLFINEKSKTPTRYVNAFLLLLIVLNVLAVILETVVSIQVRYARAFE